MRYIKYLFLAAVAISLITLALANRSLVTLQLLPSDIAEVAGLNASIELPLFLVILAGIIAGLMIGFVWEWIREHRHRSAATQAKREVAKLEREIKKSSSGARSDEADEILALLETGSKTG